MYTRTLPATYLKGAMSKIFFLFNNELIQSKDCEEIIVLTYEVHIMLKLFSSQYMQHKYCVREDSTVSMLNS